MRTRRSLTTAVAVVLLGVLGGSTAMLGRAAAGAGEAEARWNPPGDTIVRVTGDARSGFTIHHKDGTRRHPPTYSESMAECSEYDTQVARVRCRTEVRIWYRDLADTKRAINWARYVARR